ncbi:MAG TPA: hypothetical protein VEQ85_10000 [Lacipirellulaceae bacterium]|nr:hypothetical protein [Lacipirellulaceae bacterium]
MNQTYHLAATSNGSTLSLYLDQANGLGYQLAASMNLTGSSNTALARDTVGSTTPGDPTFGWSVGRGRSGQGDLQGDNHVDRWLGFIDEVRISDVALAPNQLLFAGQNAPAGPSLLINRDTGVISLTNLRSSLQVRQYQIDSPNGALNIAQHTPIGGRLDSQGNSSFDSDGVWFSQTAISATQIIEEDVASPDGGALGVGGTQTIVLSGTDGWIANPTESVTASVQVYDPVLGNVTFGVPVLFTGNGGVAFRRGDLNTDGAITGLDWAAFRTNAHSAAAVGLTDAQSYSLGDLDGDQDVDYADFRAFQGLYDAANGVGALDAVIAAVPEPSAALLALAACGSLAAVRRRAQA